MKVKSKQKSKTTDKKPAIEGSWSKVKISGNLITNDGGGLEGLIGLEVLEDYDNNIISKAKVTSNCKIFNVCIVLSHTAFKLQKSKKREREDNDDGLNDKLTVKKNKKQKVNKAVPPTPGRYVLMNKNADEESEDREGEDIDEIETADLIVRPTDCY